MSTKKITTKRFLAKRWVGNLTDLTEILNNAVDLMSEKVETPKIILEILIDDTETTSNDVKELAELSNADVQGLKNIMFRVYGSDSQYTEPYIKINVSSLYPAIELKVSSKTQSFTEGAIMQLSKKINHGKKQLNRDTLELAGAFLFSPLIMLSGYLGPNIARWFNLASYNDKWDPAEIVGAIVVLIVFLVLYLWLYWLIPTLEITPQTSKSRCEKSFKVFVGLLLTILISLIASFIYDILF